MLLRFDQLYVDYQNVDLLGVFDEVEFEIPNGEQITFIRENMDCLKQSEKFIRLLEGDKYVTISHVPVLLHDCITSLQGIADRRDNNRSMVDLANTLRRSIESRLGFILDQENLALCHSALSWIISHLYLFD